MIRRHIGFASTRPEHGIAGTDPHSRQYAKRRFARDAFSPHLIGIVTGSGIAPAHTQRS